MAYLIFENIEGNNLHRIAANEADKNSLHFSENDIKQHHKILIDVIEIFLQNNGLNAMATPLTNYKNYLSNFDYSSLTYPLNISWEEYCSINSITYYHCFTCSN